MLGPHPCRHTHTHTNARTHTHAHTHTHTHTLSPYAPPCLSWRGSSPSNPLPTFQLNSAPRLLLAFIWSQAEENNRRSQNVRQVSEATGKMNHRSLLLGVTGLLLNHILIHLRIINVNCKSRSSFFTQCVGGATSSILRLLSSPNAHPPLSRNALQQESRPSVCLRVSQSIELCLLGMCYRTLFLFLSLRRGIAEKLPSRGYCAAGGYIAELVLPIAVEWATKLVQSCQVPCALFTVQCPPHHATGESSAQEMVYKPHPSLTIPGSPYRGQNWKIWKMKIWGSKNALFGVPLRTIYMGFLGHLIAPLNMDLVLREAIQCPKSPFKWFQEEPERAFLTPKMSFSRFSNFDLCRGNRGSQPKPTRSILSLTEGGRLRHGSSARVSNKCLGRSVLHRPHSFGRCLLS